MRRKRSQIPISHGSYRFSIPDLQPFYNEFTIKIIKVKMLYLQSTENSSAKVNLKNVVFYIMKNWWLYGIVSFSETWIHQRIPKLPNPPQHHLPYKWPKKTNPKAPIQPPKTAISFPFHRHKITNNRHLKENLHRWRNRQTSRTTLQTHKATSKYKKHIRPVLISLNQKSQKKDEEDCIAVKYPKESKEVPQWRI